MKNNIVLIGMPGCGKSTIGIVLAKRLGYHFLDTDLLIQEETGELLSQTIERIGNSGFLDVENQVLSKIDVTKTVIATGGSAIYGKEAMENLKKQGVIVYIKLPLWNLKQRLGDLKDRGVPLKKGQTLRDLYKERVVYYQKYQDISVNTKGLYLRQSVSKVEDKILSYWQQSKYEVDRDVQ